MKKCVNGVMVEMTAEEIAELQQLETTPEITTEERLEALESAMLELLGVVE